MFNWVVKVVPQPPEAADAEKPAPAKIAAPTNNQPKPKEVSQVKSPSLKNPEENSTDSGVLGWLSNGFVSALPQPVGSPRLTRADGEKGSAVFKWVSQGLNNMLPQPDEKYRESPEVQQNEEHTEIYEVETMPDYDPLPHIPVVEMVSDDEGDNDNSGPFPQKVSKWLKQIMPQPVPPGTVVSETSNSPRSSVDKTLSPPPESLSGISLDTDSKVGSMVGWFVSGLGLKLPQPALTSKDGADGAAEVLQKASSKLQPDMVLEDVDSDNECQQKLEQSSNTAAAIPVTSLIPPSPATSHQSTSQSCKPTPAPEQSASTTKVSQEDAETQTGRWTPFIESIKKEAEDVALATMEERLLQERFEMARMAEEVAKQTAEMAIRQMAMEGQSIKLSLGSQDLMEEPDVELPLPPEEETEEDSKLAEKESILPEAEKSEEPAVSQGEATAEIEAEPQQNESQVEAKVDPNPEPEPIPEPAPEPQPVNETQEASLADAPVTKQPQRAEENGQTNNKPTETLTEKVI